MKYRIIDWQGSLYIVVGIGYNARFDPPDIFYAVSLEDTLLKSLLIKLETIEIPFSEVIEITSETTIQSIWILYGE